MRPVPEDRSEPLEKGSTDPEVLRCLLNPLRMELVYELGFRGGKARVSDLAAAVGKPVNSVSYHLSEMRKRDLVAKIEAPQGADARETWYEVTRGLSFNFDEPGNPLLGLVAQLSMGDSPAYVRQRRAAIVSGEPVADRVTVATLTLKLTVDQQRDFRARLDELLGDMTAAADANREEGAETGVVAVTAEFFPVLEK